MCRNWAAGYWCGGYNWNSRVWPIRLTHCSISPFFISHRDFGTLGETELLSATLALSTIDHILVLGEDGLNDVIMRAGMGWTRTLRNKHWRW